MEWNDSLVATDGLRSYSTDSQNPIVSNITDCCVVEIEGNYTGKAATNKKQTEKDGKKLDQSFSVDWEKFPFFSSSSASFDRSN